MKIMEDAETIWKKALSSGLLSCEMKICKATWEDESNTHTYLNKWERDSFTGAAGTPLLYPANRFLPKEKKNGEDGFNRQMLIFSTYQWDSYRQVPLLKAFLHCF